MSNLSIYLSFHIGTGKTHTIANIICASLCHGKRVLITSKGAAALSVIRERLPPSVQDLCVDVSLSESQGMRQLQQTVERLANRVACVSTDTEAQKCRLLSVRHAVSVVVVDVVADYYVFIVASANTICFIVKI